MPSCSQWFQVSDITEGEGHKLGKKFKEGTCVRVRIFGTRRLEGLAVGVLKVGPL